MSEKTELPLVELLNRLWRHLYVQHKRLERRYPSGCTVRFEGGREVYVRNARRVHSDGTSARIYQGPEPGDIPEKEFWKLERHPFHWLIRTVARKTGVSRTCLVEVAYRAGSGCDFGAVKFHDGRSMPDVSDVLPKLDALDEDGRTARLVAKLWTDYPDVARQAKLPGPERQSERAGRSPKSRRRRGRRTVPTLAMVQAYRAHVAGFTHRQIAAECGVSPMTVGRWVRFVTEWKTKSRSVRARQSLPTDRRGNPTVETPPCNIL